MGGWKIAAMGVIDGDKDFQIDGVAIWSKAWKRLPVQPVRFREPLYGQWHRFDVYELEEMPGIRFAATELSNNIWGFLVPKQPHDEPEHSALLDGLTRRQKQMALAFVLGVLSVILFVALR